MGDRNDDNLPGRPGRPGRPGFPTGRPGAYDGHCWDCNRPGHHAGSPRCWVDQVRRSWQEHFDREMAVMEDRVRRLESSRGGLFIERNFGTIGSAAPAAPHHHYRERSRSPRDARPHRALPGPPGRPARGGYGTLGPAPRRGSPRPARAALPAPSDAPNLRIQAPPEEPPVAGHPAPGPVPLAPGPPAPSSAAAGPSSVNDRLEMMRSEALERRAALRAARHDLWAQHEASQVANSEEDVDMTSGRDPKDEKK